MGSRCLNSMLFAILTWSACAQADERQSSMYLGADFGRSSVSSHVYEEKSDPVFGFSFGYQVTPDASVEVFWRSLSFRMLDSLVGDDSYYPSEHLGVAIVGALPLSERVHLLGRLGVGRTTMTSAFPSSRPDDHKTEASVGAGLAYDFAQRWAVKFTVTGFTETKVSTTLIGFEYRF